MLHKFHSWRCKRVAKKMSKALKENFGNKKFYSASEVDSAARLVGLSAKQRELAYAMFAEEEACNGFLREIGSTMTAKERRTWCAGSMFGVTTPVGYDSLWNRFHDYNDEVIGGLQSVGNASGGGDGNSYGGDGGWDSGGGSDGGGDGE
jgi:uncharacterized membrane protein YgcG